VDSGPTILVPAPLSNFPAGVGVRAGGALTARGVLGNVRRRMEVRTAIIFDMDDTLVASGPVWREAEERLFAALGSAYRPEIALKYKGQNARDVGATIRRELAVSDRSEDECGRRMREFLLEAFARPVPALEGADALVRALATRYPLAVASGSPEEAIRSVLARSGWSALFEVVVSSESVRAGKPAPDVFLAAARLLGAIPARCLVFEDSLHGARAARAAGMPCFVVPSMADPRIGELADRVYPSLAAVTIADVRAVLAQASTKKG
jgi:HAD superfamily hydrolase (TIGR01509 family)